MYWLKDDDDDNNNNNNNNTLTLLFFGTTDRLTPGCHGASPLAIKFTNNLFY